MPKEKSCLVTQNIIEKTRWYVESPNTVIKTEKGGDGHTTWKEKALQDLRDTLARVSKPFPEAAKRGVDFEKKLYAVASSGEMKGSPEFQAMCQAIHGFEYYKKGGKHVPMDGLDLFFYAKYDAISPDKRRIKDVKTTGAYRARKYLHGIQHKIYCYIEEAEYFQYVIAEWDEWPKIKKVHYEDFYVQNQKALEDDILFATRECFDIIKDLGLWETYRTKYCLY